MAGIVRFGVSIEESLLAEFDGLISRKGYASRSDAIRALIRNLLLEAQVQEQPEAEVVGTITLVYDHSRGDLTERLVELQHRNRPNIVSSLHVHIDERNCLEVLAVKGINAQVRSISDALIGTRGVQQGRLIITAASGETDGEAAVHGHPHRH
jgi:CopG family nickel-responsive transcriptional regulator